MIEDIVIANRSYRRFLEDRRISETTLKDLVNLARLSPSGANLQPLKYMLSTDPAKNELIFPCTAWAGYLKGWDGPIEGERPSAYIIILGDKTISANFGCDQGIAAQSIMLGAAEKKIGGCIIGSVDSARLRKSLQIPEQYEILLVIALGYPKETIVLEEVPSSGSIRYWRDEEGIHHVPKRSLDEIVLK